MADFEIAFNMTDLNEGKYVNNTADRGGETYRGIARNFNPGWAGWKIIDGYKSKASFPKILNDDTLLQKLVKEFYKTNFWNAIKGDLIVNQAIANEVYDNAVNMGVGKSAEYLQRAINILNRNQRNDFYPDIKVDSSIGAKTVEALNHCIKKNGVNLLLNVINGFQVRHYLTLMERNPADEIFIGWFKRVEILWN